MKYYILLMLLTGVATEANFIFERTLWAKRCAEILCIICLI